MRPLILADIPKNSPAYKEELFGPVFSLFKYDNIEDGINLANDTIYGLGGTVIGKDIENAKKVAE